MARDGWSVPTGARKLHYMRRLIESEHLVSSLCHKHAESAAEFEPLDDRTLQEFTPRQYCTRCKNRLEAGD